jgi:uncharacterized protein DUF4388
MEGYSPEPLGPDDDLTIRGEIGDTSVAELLRSLLSSRETGILTLRNGDVTKSIYIRAGRVLYAASTNVDERLGENLLLRGRITARQYVEASKMIRPGRRLGAILVEMGALDSEELIPAVEHQVKEILLDLFGWTHGTYELVIKEVDPETVFTVNVSTENLLLEGIRRVRSWSQLMRGLGDIGAVLARATGADHKIELTTEEQEVLAQVNGRSTVEQICDVSYLSHYDTCRILWGLLVVGILVRRGQADAAAEEGARELERELDLEGIVEKFNQMFGRIYTFLQGRLGREVDDFMDAVLEDVSRQYGSLFGGVDLKQYGRADFEQMLANVADLPPEQRKSLMVSGLNELVFVIQLSVRTRFGKEEEAVVSGIIKEGFRRLGAA